jgi:hypothetical protein
MFKSVKGFAASHSEAIDQKKSPVAYNLVATGLIYLIG